MEQFNILMIFCVCVWGVCVHVSHVDIAMSPTFIPFAPIVYTTSCDILYLPLRMNIILSFSHRATAGHDGLPW